MNGHDDPYISVRTSRRWSLSHGLLRGLLRDVVAPLALCTGDLEGPVLELQRAVVRIARHADHRVPVIAAHLGLSDRTIYGYLAMVPRPRLAGVRLMGQVLRMVTALRQPFSPGDCLRHLRRQQPDLLSSMHELTAIEELLDLYVSLGHLERVSPAGGAREQDAYRIAGGEASVRLAIGHSREWLSAQLHTLPGLLLSCAGEAHPSSMCALEGRVSPRHLADALRDMRLFLERRWERAVSLSEEDPEASRCDAAVFFAAGPLGTMPDSAGVAPVEVAR